MRYLMLFLFFSLPSIAGATISASISEGETAISQQAIPHGFTQKRQGFLERLLEKKMTKHLGKAIGASRGDGKGLAIAGLIAFLLSVASWVLSPFWGFSAGLPLALFGLLLSIICLSKAKPWDSGLASKLAILGIVLNGIALVFGMVRYMSLIGGH